MGLSDLKSVNNQTTKFSLIGEIKRYSEAFLQYWPLVLGIGLFFGWLLSFPFQGPLFGALASGHNLEPLPLTVMFLVCHILGQVIAGVLIFFFRRLILWLSLGTVPCFIISLILSDVSASMWGLLFALLGLFSGVAIISWGVSFASYVNPARRGHTFILGAVLANIILYLVANLTVRSFDVNLVKNIISFLSLALPVFLIYWYFKIASTRETFPKEGSEPKIKPWQWWTLLPFIFAIYAVGGIMYAVVGTLASPPTVEMMSLFGVIPYLVFLFIAGILADLRGRALNAVLGAIIIGFGFMAIGLLKGNWQFIVIQTFLVGGFAFLDTFTWVIVADLSNKRWMPVVYSAILGINILAILVGVLLAGSTGALASGKEVLTISLAGIFCLISLAFAPRLKEILSPNVIKTSAVPAISWIEWSQKSGFTPRELDIAKLLIEGASTKEMLDTLVIAPDTLKTHLRNIYRKSGVRNRVEFTLAVMKDTANLG